jgi:hypothetical protein
MNTPMRVCSQCQTPLAASESVCRNCGASYVEPITTAMTEPTTFVADRSSPESMQEAVSLSFDEMSSKQNTVDEPTGQGEGLLPLVPGGVDAQVPPRRKGPNVGLIVGALLLIVVLVGSGLFFLVKARGITLTATPTATPGIGVAVVGGKWRLTVEKVHQETLLSGGLSINTTTYTPNSGYIFLVVDIKLRELDSPQFVLVSTDMFAIINQDGKITTAALISINAGTGYAGIIATSGSNELNLSVAFVVPQGSIGQVFKLRFQQLPLIPFSTK